MIEPPISRGFRARRRPDSELGRVPPGQHVTEDFPVLSAGPTPRADPSSWSLTLHLGDDARGTWTGAAFAALPQTQVAVDIHCVTGWSKLDTTWQGVTIDTLLAATGLPGPPAPHVLIHCDGGYTTNLAAADLVAGQAMIATRHAGAPLAPEHGGPARLLVPHLYLWKSAKWVRRIQFLRDDVPGFWEGLGYHMRGDPWREQRYAGD